MRINQKKSTHQAPTKNPPSHQIEDCEKKMKERAKEVWDEAVDLYSYADEETDWHFEEYYKAKYG